MAGVHILRGEKGGESLVLRRSTSIPATPGSDVRKFTTQTDGFMSIDDSGMARRIDYEGNWCFKQTTITPLSSPQNNMAIGTGAFFRIGGIGSLVITGLAGGSEGRRIVICYVGAASVRFLEDNAGSLPGNRMLLGNGGSYVQLATDHSIELIFDSTTRKWRRIGTIN